MAHLERRGRFPPCNNRQGDLSLQASGNHTAYLKSLVVFFFYLYFFQNKLCYSKKIKNTFQKTGKEKNPILSSTKEGVPAKTKKQSNVSTFKESSGTQKAGSWIANSSWSKAETCT